jgi:hypothetical protein
LELDCGQLKVSVFKREYDGGFRVFFRPRFEFGGKLSFYQPEDGLIDTRFEGAYDWIEELCDGCGTV